MGRKRLCYQKYTFLLMFVFCPKASKCLKYLHAVFLRDASGLVETRFGFCSHLSLSLSPVSLSVRACVRLCVCVCVCARARACVRARTRGYAKASMHSLRFYFSSSYNTDSFFLFKFNKLKKKEARLWR